MSYQLKARLLKQRLAVFNRATLPTSTSVVPKQTRTPLGGTGFPETGDIQINPQDGRSIADAYDGLKHNPNDSKVKASYGALIKETKSQYGDLIKGGLKPNASDRQYKNSDALHLDIENKRINFFPTSSGLGSTETGGVPTDHPMLQPSGVKINGKEVLNNDLFRIVHDVNGHFRGQASGFGPQGEQQAFLTHKQMFSPLAGKALFTETAGQNNWINFSKKFGASNRANPKNTVFAEQKAALFPDSIINSKVHQPRGRRGKQRTADTFLERDKDPLRRIFGRPGVNRKEKLRERRDFFKDIPTATQKDFEEETYSDNDIISLDEEFAEGIPEPRVEGFSKILVDHKITGTTPEGKYLTTDEPVNVDKSIANMEPGTSSLSETLEDRRVERTLLKNRGQGESFGETFSRKFGAPSLNKSPAGKELKFNEFSQGVISRPLAKKLAKLKQRIGQVRLAYAGIHAVKPVLDAFKNKKSLRFGEKVKGKNKEYAFQTDGKILYQSGYPIAEHTKNGIKYSYQGHPTNTTADTARYLGIDTFQKNGVTYINGQEIDPYGFDYVEVPYSDISNTPVKVNPKSKPIISEETKQKNKDQEAFRVKAEKESLKGNQDFVVQTKKKKEVLDYGSITKNEQKRINKITGVGKDIDEIFATTYHHSLPVEKGGGLGGGVINRRMTGGAVPLSRKTLFEAHFPEKTIPKPFYNKISQLQDKLQLGKLRLKLANIKQRPEEMIKTRKHKLSIFDHLKSKGSSADASHHHSIFLSPSGEFIGGGRKNTSHKEQLQKHFKFPTDEGKSFMDNVMQDEKTMFQIMKQTGLVRVQNTTFLSQIRGKNDPHKISLDINTKLTGSQNKAIRDLEAFGHEVSGTTERQNYQVGVRELLRDNGRNFAGPVMAKLRLKLALITPLIKKKKTTKPIRKIRVKEGMIQTAAMLSADAIINNFIKTKQNIRGVSGVFDPVENRILDATKPGDAMRLQRFYKSGNNKLGLNSITDTRLGPESNIENIRGQLKGVEQSGGIPALGFDEGSLEALDVAIGKSDNDIFSKLKEHQRSTGILDEDLTFRIEDNPIFKSK